MDLFIVSEKEQKEYTPKFEELTALQGDTSEVFSRKLNQFVAIQWLKQWKIKDKQIDEILDLASEGEPYLMLNEFMKAMRLVSAYHSKQPLNAETLKNFRKVVRVSKIQNPRFSQEMKPAILNMEKPQVVSLETAQRSVSVEKQASPSAVKYPEIQSPEIQYPAFQSPITQPVQTIPREEVSVPNIIEQPKQNTNRLTVAPAQYISGGYFSKGYYSYTIHTKFSDETSIAERRFSHLDWINTQLNELYKGLTIPPLPSKERLTRNTEEFLERRRREIEKYLNILLGHPILGQSPILEEFLQGSASDFEAYQANVASNGYTFEIPSFEELVDTIYTHTYSKISNLVSSPPPKSTQLSEIESKVSEMHSPITDLSNAYDAWVTATTASSQAFAMLNIQDNFSDVNLRRVGMEVKQAQFMFDGLRTALDTWDANKEEQERSILLQARTRGKLPSTQSPESKAQYQSQIERLDHQIDELGKTSVKIEENIVSEFSRIENERTKHWEQTISEMIKVQCSHWCN